MGKPTIEEIEALQKDIKFCFDLASEEYPFQQNNVGAEIVLRKIIERCNY